MTKAAQIAEKLKADWLDRKPYETLGGSLAPDDLAQAYEAQAAFQAAMLERRGAIVGRKIALSNKALQEMCGIDQPVAGGIFEHELHQAPTRIATGDFIRLGLEFELALELAKDVPPQQKEHTASSVRELVANVRPAFELIEDRDADYRYLDVMTLVSDNAWCGGVVLGSPIENWRELDLDAIESTVVQAGVEDEGTNTGTASPLTFLAWVLNHFSGRGLSLKAGEHIITGSAARTRFPKSGDKFAYHVAGAVVEIDVD